MSMNIKHQSLAVIVLAVSLSTFAYAAPSTPVNNMGKTPDKETKPVMSEKNDQWTGGSKAGCKKHCHEGREKMEKALGLTPEQKKQMATIRTNFKTAHQSEFEAKRAQYQELKLMEASGASPEQIKAKRETMHQQFADLKAEHEKMETQMKAILTPEQAQKWDAMKTEWHNKKQQHHDGNGAIQPQGTTQQ